MELNDIKYDGIKNYINSLYNTHKNWDYIRSCKMIGQFDEDFIFDQLLPGMWNLKTDEINKDIWNALIDEIIERDKETNITKLGKHIWNDAVIPASEHSAWQLYKSNLERKGLSDKSIKNIEKSSFSILQQLSMDTKDSGPIKGLVIGNVQSGKTANMAGLMAMAADNGFNYFIILSGVIENLRQQTATRLYEDMNTSGYSNLEWKQIDKPSVKSRIPEHNISKFNLSLKDRTKYFTVTLKNKKRLESLIKWLTYDKNKAEQLRILIIDDEADQASVNTKDIEEEDQTAINHLIRQLVNNNTFAGMNYISYTATPYANILNETDVDSLYPKDFIVALEPSEDYIGPKQIFGVEEPETSAVVDITRVISDEDALAVRELQKDEADYGIPESFKKSVNWFVLTVAAMRALDYNKPISMLVHTSFKIVHHKVIAENIESYLRYLKHNISTTMPELRELYENETVDFKRSFFLKGMNNYSSPDEVPDYPSFEAIKPYLERLFRLEDKEFVSHIPIGEEGEPAYHKGFHLAIDNSQSRADDQIVRLMYPKKNQMPNVAPAFIVVGGNTLSRGLTIEGLTSTFFLRTTNQADTLMQMGRWFGYRKGYEIFPRVWMERLAYERFQFLAQMNEELREEIEQYSTFGWTPTDYAPKVKNSVNNKLIRITSSNKMQKAKDAEYDFNGFNSQTIYFENNEQKLKDNLSLTKQFLNGLDEPEISKNHMIWRNVRKKDVKKFLKNYIVCEKDIKMSCLKALTQWIDKNEEYIADWNVIYATKGPLSRSSQKNSDWEIHGYQPKASTRTRLIKNSTDEITSIGSLRTPSDLLADIIDNEKTTADHSEIQYIREKSGYGNVPQLIIYKIDKDNRTPEEYKEITKGNKPNREPLNFPADIIGINVMIPGSTNRDNMVKYVTAQIDVKNEPIDEEEIEE